MKKKVKLFTTIASLCLAVALMAFGVYAALQANLTVSGSIKFTATGVDGYFKSVAVEAVTDCEVANGTATGTATAHMEDLTGVEVTVNSGKNACKFTVTVVFANIGSTNAIKVTPSTGANENGITYTNAEEKTVAAGEEATFVITIEYAAVDQAQNATTDWNVSFVAAQAQA